MWSQLFGPLCSIYIHFLFDSDHIACGGSLITEKLVISAAHCVVLNASETFIALGMHNMSGFATWSEQELSKHTITNVSEIIKHPLYDDHRDIQILFFDFALFILETPVKISMIVSPVCLPLPKEFDTLEKENNILIGFGLTRMWFQLYNELLGGELKRAPLIPAEILFNGNLIINKLEQPNFQKNIIDGYFKTLKDIFPGIEACIDDKYDIVRQCLYGAKNEEIVMNIANKISNTGRDMEEEVVKQFLGFYAFNTNNLLIGKLQLMSLTSISP